MGWNKKKKGRGDTDFKNEGKLGQGMGALKKGGTGSPIRTMVTEVYLGPCKTFMMGRSAKTVNEF